MNRVARQTGSPVGVEQVGTTLWVRLARPEKANALNRATVTSLLEIVAEAEREGTIRLLILTGMGHVFCAGADLAEILAGGSEGLRELLSLIRELTGRIERSPIIVVAAVNGAARAGGLELVLACDAVVAGQSASFGDAHLANGILPGGGSTARLPRVIGWQRAKWLILSGSSIDAVTATDWGLVHKVVPDDELAAAAQDIGELLHPSDGRTTQRAKQLLAMTSEQPLAASLEAEIATLEAHYHSVAFQSGIKTFLERHKTSGQS